MLEEIYYFEVARGGFGFQHVYGSARAARSTSPPRCARRRDRHPHGYHGPAMAAPGRPLLPERDGRPERTGLAHHRRSGPRLDPRHLGSQALDPRLPLAAGQESRVRLTVGQAAGCFLAAQRSERDRKQPAADRRLLRHLRPRQRRRHRAGAVGVRAPTPRRDAVLPGAQRAGDGPRGGRLRPDRNRMWTFACTSSIGPGATNMVTGAALATVNRLPVLLLPGDIFATRVASPVLQELEDPRYSTSASTTSSGRSRASSTASAGPEQLPLVPARRHACAHRPSRDRRGDDLLPQDVGPRPRTCRRNCSERRVWHVRRAQPKKEAMVRRRRRFGPRRPADRLRRRRHLLRRHRRPALLRRPRRASRWPKPRPGKGASHTTTRSPRGDRRHRHDGGQRDRRMTPTS